jgi:hypothetical protein
MFFVQWTKKRKKVSLISLTRRKSSFLPFLFNDTCFTSCSDTSEKRLRDIFPLGCCDHISFSLCFYSSSSHNCIIIVLVKHWSIARAESQTNCDSPYKWHLSWILKIRTCVPRVPNMINYIFLSQLLQSSPMESDYPCSKKQGLISLAFH